MGVPKYNVESNRYPFYVVWTQIPFLSYILPFIGHIGIGTPSGIIHDYSGSLVNTDNLAFGDPLRVWGLDASSIEPIVYSQAILEADKQFDGKKHNMITTNCHHYVAFVLNKINYMNKRWTPLKIWLKLMFSGEFVSVAAALHSILPLVVFWGSLIAIICVLL